MDNGDSDPNGAVKPFWILVQTSKQWLKLPGPILGRGFSTLNSSCNDWTNIWSTIHHVMSLPSHQSPLQYLAFNVPSVQPRNRAEGGQKSVNRNWWDQVMPTTADGSSATRSGSGSDAILLKQSGQLGRKPLLKTKSSLNNSLFLLPWIHILPK